jgi:Lon protease-like protein
MSEYDETFDLDSFSGVARLFPLPNLTMFPHVLQPLHIFEPRYRDLMKAALEDDQCITIVGLMPGWEADYEGRPAVYEVGCLARIATHQRLDDGRFNLLLQGISRIRIEAELAPTKSFREARVAICHDVYPPPAFAARPALYRELLTRFMKLLPASSVMEESVQQLQQLLSHEIPLGVLTDIVAYTMDFDPALKQQLLEMTDVDARARLLLERFAGVELNLMPGRMRSEKFPPDFSSN